MCSLASGVESLLSMSNGGRNSVHRLYGLAGPQSSTIVFNYFNERPPPPRSYSAGIILYNPIPPPPIANEIEIASIIYLSFHKGAVHILCNTNLGSSETLLPPTEYCNKLERPPPHVI